MEGNKKILSMDTIDLSDLSKYRVVQRPEVDYVTQLLDALRRDAHCQASHRELDAYLSKHRVNAAFSECILYLIENMPEDPYAGLVYHLSKIKATRTHPLCVTSAKPSHCAVHIDNKPLKEQLIHLLKIHPHLSALAPQVQANLLNDFVFKEYPIGSTICEVDTPTEGLVFILSGRVYARYRDGRTAVLQTGQFFGEQCCLATPGALNFTATVYDPAVDKDDTKCIETRGAQPVCVAILPRGAYIKRAFSQQRTMLSGDCAIEYLRARYPSLSDDELSFVSSLGELRVFPKDTALVKQGQMMTELLIVIDGWGEEFTAGAIFGEGSVFFGRAEPQTVTCGTATQCMAISSAELRLRPVLFQALCKKR